MKTPTFRNPRPIDPIGDERGFTLIEVLAAVVVLMTGIVALLGMLVVGNHATAANRERQEATSVAREVMEDVRSLPYTQLVQSSLASTLQPLITTSSVSGSNLTVTRATGSGTGAVYTFHVAFTECSLDDQVDGYGSHTLAPASGGSWCPDVASSGTADTNPDDYKRVSVTVTPTTNTTASKVQQTVLVYARATNGPAISCMTTTSGSCPGSNVSVTSSAVTSLKFFVTAIFATPASIQWLVNGSEPSSSQIPTGANDPYVPSSTSSNFTWNFPTADGSYTIAALSYDGNGNAGTQSTLQVTLNRHQAIPPSSVSAGWNNQISGAEVQWVPSIDQDVQYYNVYHGYSSSGPWLPACTKVTGTSCYDQTAISPNPGSEPTCTSTSQSYTGPDYYYVVGVDTDPATGLARESTSKSTLIDANLCDHPPNAPSNLTGTLSGGKLTLNWTAPSDPDSWDGISEYRIYRWSSGGTQFPGSRYDLVGATSSTGGSVTSYSDNSPDPGGSAQKYCVTAVDTHLDESPCSNSVSG